MMHVSHSLSSVLLTALGFGGVVSAQIHEAVIPVPNVPGDDTASVAAAFAQVGTQPTRLVFSPGVYDLFETAGPQSFAIAGANSVVLEGNGATIRLHRFDPNAAPGQPEAYPTTLLDFEAVDGLTVRGLTFEMVREPYSSGVIVDKDPGGTWIRLQMDQAYPDLASGFQIQRIDDIHPTTGALESQHFTTQLAVGEYQTVVEPGSPTPTVRVSTTLDSDDWFEQKMAEIAEGERLLLMHSKFRCHFLRARSCTDLLVTDVTLHDMPGMGVLAINTENVTVDDFDLVSQNGRLMSITADGVHLKDCTGDIVMRNCQMDRMGDDGLNVHGKYVEVKGKCLLADGRTQVELAIFNEYWHMEWEVGDQIQFSRPDMRVYATETLQRFEDTSTGSQPTTFLAVFANDPGFAEDDLVCNDSNTPNTVLVEDCNFAGNIAHGVVIKADWSVVQRCTFRATTAAGLKIEADASDYYESQGVQHAVVHDCEFVDCNRFSWDDLGALSIFAQYRDGTERVIAPLGVHGDLQITANRFTNLTNATGNVRSAIWVTSSAAVVANDNTFSNIDPNLTLIRAENTATLFMNNGNCAEGFTGTKVVSIRSLVVEPTVGPPCW